MDFAAILAERRISSLTPIGLPGLQLARRPMFWLHHAMIDRTWWIWQNQKPLERAFIINGTRTMLNDPPSDSATIEDIISMDYVTPRQAPPEAIKHHVSTVAAPYCYIYG